MAISPLEALPPELLQEIFVLSDLNLEFPESSPYIARKLSDPYLYRLLCNRHLDLKNTARISRRAAEPIRQQNRIFAYKWMTWDVYKTFIIKRYEESGCLCDESGCANPCWPPDFANPTSMLFDDFHRPATSLIACSIPKRLVRGPWTKDKLQFLRFLLWTTSMNIDWRRPEAVENTKQGRKEAVLERNLEAVQLLNNCRRVCRAPKLEDVRFAVIDGGCDRSIVYDTMEAVRMWGVVGKGWNCEVLDQWCAYATANTGNPKGRWLKLKLEELRSSESSKSAQTRIGYMLPGTGDYDHVEGDQLIIARKKWNGPWPRLSDVLNLRGNSW
jgi:hypothetical protein